MSGIGSVGSVGRHVLAALVGLAVSACAKGVDMPSGPPEPLRFQVANALLAPVKVSVDGTPVVILKTGAKSDVGVAPGAQRLTWTTAKPTDAAGVQIPDDIRDVPLPFPSVGAVIEFSNVIDGQPHFTASIVNHTNAAVSIGVFDGAAVACAGALSVLTDLGGGFVQTGYFRLGPATELRAYRDPTHCTGPFVAWPRSQLLSFTPKTGAVRLSLDTVP